MISAVHCGHRCPLTASWACDLLMMVSRVCKSTSKRLSTIISTSSMTSASWSEQRESTQLVPDLLTCSWQYLLSQPHQEWSSDLILNTELLASLVCSVKEPGTMALKGGEAHLPLLHWFGGWGLTPTQHHSDTYSSEPQTNTLISIYRAEVKVLS